MYEKEPSWVGLGDNSCTNPKILWESVVVKLKSLVSVVDFKFFDGTNEEFTTSGGKAFTSLLQYHL